MINVATPPAINTIITDPISVIPTIETTPVDKTIETPTTTDSIFADFMSGNDPLVSSPLFDMTPPVVSTPNESIESGVVSQDVSFHNTGELLQHEIREIDRFIGNLDLADATKLTEEDEYRKQKEHYAELELRAETEHKKMLEERSHAEKMRKYLEHEQAGEVVTV